MRLNDRPVKRYSPMNEKPTLMASPQLARLLSGCSHLRCDPHEESPTGIEEKDERHVAL
ncbi:MAG: hypothetical protein AAGJ83_04155 [Planctomycetota bacterium]